MPNEKYLNSLLTHKRSWIKIGLIVGVSAWMFVLGILVGRGTAPIKFNVQNLEQKLITKRQIADRKEMEAVTKNIEIGTDEAELGFYKTLKSSKTDDNLPNIPAETETKTKTKTETKTKIDIKRNVGKKPVAAEKKAMVGLYTVQVASLRSKDSAQKIVNELIEKGYDAFVTTSSSSGAGTWYRVRIGNYKNKSEAGNIAEKMKSESFQPIVVRRK
jgi:cell division protein FtsN